MKAKLILLISSFFVTFTANAIPPEFVNHRYVYESDPSFIGAEKRNVSFTHTPVYDDPTDTRILTHYRLTLSIENWEGSQLIERYNSWFKIFPNKIIASNDNISINAQGIIEIKQPLPRRSNDQRTYYAYIFRITPSGSTIIESRFFYKEYSDEIIYQDHLSYRKLQ